MLKLSIITINRNNDVGLQKTIDSVVKQTFTDFEYIIIDGASTDGSVEVIKQYEDRVTYWISEPDQGIYNAMNKGIVKAKGEYCFFLNSGDCFISNHILEIISRDFHSQDIVSGFVIGFEGDKKKEIHPPELFTLRFLFNQNIPHQAEFIKRTLFASIGLYNENLRILSDYEFNLKALLNDVSIKFIDECISIVDLNGVSSSDASSDIIDKEQKIIFETSFPKGILQDYRYWMNRNTFSHKSIIWLVKSKFWFKFVKFLYLYIYNNAKKDHK